MACNLSDMTNGPTPPAPQPVKNEAEYARKLALAILSTLESKGLLSKMDVEAILHVAHRSAMRHAVEEAAVEATAEAQAKAETAPQDETSAAEVKQSGETESKQPDAPSVLTAPIEVKRPLGPAVLGTRWVKPDAALPDATRDAAAALAHETGAVKVTGQVAPAQSRPLAPAILTEKQAAPAPVETPVEEKPLSAAPLSEAEVKSQVESNLKAIESKAQAQQGTPEKDKENPKDQHAVPVIDFDLG